jgi:hypothetical protein
MASGTPCNVQRNILKIWSADRWLRTFSLTALTWAPPGLHCPNIHIFCIFRRKILFVMDFQYCTCCSDPWFGHEPLCAQECALKSLDMDADKLNFLKNSLMSVETRNFAVEWLYLLLRIWEVPGWNLGPKTCHAYCDVVKVSSVPP